MSGTRMVLRRTEPHGTPADSATSRIEADPNIALLDRSSASALLVEGKARSIRQAVKELTGWVAVPVIGYARPDLRPRIRRKPEAAE
ncbi:hypothetical protein [Methylobacterium isbiliense]|uniref:Uncharacterized protein n=1 Tax=Methylobacterium isbiliense TaxID=315478 RepID=A0ABQ4S926_9HYPH|nr:hypothetical protein [Methylobacterium isbiliense]MDN3624995.1 hypothetical protein [Methylobacterium isbiliense]GJD98872.1 hypothetical protein GMJLKIPL_0785 [Methylobacterium isbiliense]